MSDREIIYDCGGSSGRTPGFKIESLRDCASVECGIEAERISYRSGQGEHPVFPEKDLLQ